MADAELKKIYQAAYNFLLIQDSVTEEDLKRHLVSEINKPENLKVIYRLFCSSAQNRQMSTKVISGSIGGLSNLGKILFDFDPHEVAKKYAKTDNLVLLNDIKEKLSPRGKIRETSRSIWPQYCRSVLDAAYFLQKFSSAKEFYNWADIFVKDEKTKPALPLMISLEITGIGFPLACDILKELGYSEYGKPDVHLKDIFRALKIIDPLEKSTIKQDYETLKAIDQIAKANDLTAYAVDKTFWLIGSGNFYLSGKNIGNHKKEFINLMLKNKSK